MINVNNIVQHLIKPFRLVLRKLRNRHLPLSKGRISHIQEIQFLNRSYISGKLGVNSVSLCGQKKPNSQRNTWYRLSHPSTQCRLRQGRL